MRQWMDPCERLKDGEERIWVVHVAIPPTAPQRWAENKDFVVSADTLELAAARARESFPDCVIWSIHHHGKLLVLRNKP
jgi:hypothetical protein